MTAARASTLALASVALVCSCKSSEKRYNVMPKGKLHSAMWRLANLADELDGLLRDPETTPDQQAVIAKLTQMETVARGLSQPGQRKRHPLIDSNIDEFVSNISLARRAAKKAPPNYYLAGAVAGSCIYCHDPEGGIRTD